MAKLESRMMPGGQVAVMPGYLTKVTPDVDDVRALKQVGQAGGGHTLAHISRNVLGASRVSATVTDTISGSPVAGDTASLTVGVRGGVTVTTTVVGTMTTAQVAAALAAAVNADSSLQGIVSAVSAGSVVTLIHSGGEGGNYVTVEDASTGGLSQSLSGGSFAGGSGPIKAVENFAFPLRSTPGAAVTEVRTFEQGHVYNVDASVARQLVEGGAPVA
jgi:hypothetical protein